MDRPHASQRYTRSDRDSLAFTAPHVEHVLLDGYHLSITRNAAPVRAVLYSSWRRNSPREASLTLRARRWFFTMPATFRSSMHTTLYVLAIMVVALLIASARTLATRACRRATRSWAFLRRALPLVLRLNACWAFRRAFSLVFRARGLGITVPSESVARFFTPRSTPTAPSFGVLLGRGSRSTVKLAYQWPACRDTLTRIRRAPATRS